MPREYRPYIPKTLDELHDQISSMMLSSPRFEDRTGYFPGMNLETEFFALNEGLRVLREKLGEQRYHTLVDLAARMRAHFEADPEDKTDEAIKGRAIIFDMEDILAPLEAAEHLDSGDAS